MNTTLLAGAAQMDISPSDSQFLAGYPHVKRYSTGIHDRLWSSALYLAAQNEQQKILFIANDIIYISKDMAANIRAGIGRRTGLAPEAVMITATHTHSGPKTVDNPINQADPVIPDADPAYVRYLENQAIKAGIAACRKAEPAKVGLARADVRGIGTNRRDPDGPADLEAPVLMAADLNDRPLACMIVTCMHPTVLHEDSTLISGDFPGLARLYLQEKVFGTECPVLLHTGPAGNQSPRHVTRGNTFSEASRLGEVMGRAVARSLENIEYHSDLKLKAARVLLEDLPRRRFPTVAQAQDKLDRAAAKLASLRRQKAPGPQTRTAECDWFGAEKTLAMAAAAADGTLDAACRRCLPAEIQILKVGKWNFVGWPGEVFIEYALEVKKQLPDTFVTAYANGLLNGYIVTESAAREGGYEAASAQFGWQTGELLVTETLTLAERIEDRPERWR